MSETLKRPRRPGEKRKRWRERLDNFRTNNTPRFTPDELRRSILKDDYYEFVKAMWHVVSSEKPVWNWHIKFLCRKVQKICEKIFRGEAKMYDLCVNVPPGTTKSTILSVMLPAWCWTRMPSFRFIGASYGGDIAQDLSMKTRDVVRSELYKRLFFDIKWRADQDTKNYFLNTKGGWRFSVGVKGDVTGRHAHLIVIDDPLNPEESYSDAEIATSNRWIRETLSSRKVDKAVTVMILVMQRLHQDDPTSNFVARKNVYWVCLPAEKTEHIKPHRLRKFYKQGLLDVKRLPREVLQEEESRGSYYYAAQFLQTPVPRGGGMFDVSRIKVSRHAPECVQVTRGWDKAGVEGGTGAFTCGVKLGVDKDGVVWILDLQRFRLSSVEREAQIYRSARRDGQSCRIIIEQEPGSGGKESAEQTVRNLRGFRVTVIKASNQTGDKAQRADPFSSQVNGGNVRMVKAPWNDDLIDELRYFPVSRYKDQVDALSLAFNELQRPKLKAGALRTSLTESMVPSVSRLQYTNKTSKKKAKKRARLVAIR